METILSFHKKKHRSVCDIEQQQKSFTLLIFCIIARVFCVCYFCCEMFAGVLEERYILIARVIFYSIRRRGARGMWEMKRVVDGESSKWFRAPHIIIHFSSSSTFLVFIYAPSNSRFYVSNYLLTISVRILWWYLVKDYAENLLNI